MLDKSTFEKLPVFITTMSRWDGDISSASLALAKVFSRNNPVYYIDYPYTWPDVWRERKQPTVKRRMNALLWGKDYLVQVPGQPDYLKGATPKPTIPINFLSPGMLYNAGSNYNSRQIASLVKKIVAQNGISNYLFINSFNPTFLSNINSFLQPALSVYHSRDAIGEINEYTRRHGIYRETECVQHYDMAMATSTELCKNISALAGKEVKYFPNGGDITLFKTAIEKVLPKPTELQAITTPIIGYTGAVCQRIDYELLVKIANANPDKTIVLVGPRQDKENTDINLDAIPNIVFTGPKKLDQLPAYLQYFDCAIIPFKCNGLTRGIYPLKINEYLGAGMSVVTTNFSADIASFEEHIYLSDNHDVFLQNIQLAIHNNSAAIKQQRLQAASVNAWENRVEYFWEIAWNAYVKKHQYSG
jgi:teichuronic acid biosynthesis glycosyltransferase TuaH